jgi:hypothetical protein
LPYELTSNAERRLDAAALNLFLSTFSGVFEGLSENDPKKRRLFGAETLRVGDLKELLIAADLRQLGYGPSLWDTIERKPTEFDARQQRSLYRTFTRMVAGDFSWFASAAAWFFGADETPAPIGPQVVTGVEEIASATRRTPAGVLRLIQGGKLPVYTVDGKPTSTHAMLRPHRRYGVTALAA